MVKYLQKLQVVDFFNLFLITSAIIGVGFSIILFFSKNGRDKSMIYLNLMLLSIVLNNFQSWVLAKQLFQNNFILGYVQIPWHFLTAPFFYMFLIHYLEIAEKSTKVLKIIIPLFLIALLSQIYFVTVYNGYEDLTKLKYAHERYTSIEEIFSLVISISIFGYSFYVLYKKENLFSKILSFDNLRWIYTFFILGTIIYLFWTIALIVKVRMNFSGFIFSYYPLRIGTTLLIFWIGYQSIIQLNLLKERRSLRLVLMEQPISNSEIETKIKNQDEFLTIHQYIVKHKKFLEPKIIRETLASELGMSKSKLSSIMNTGAQKSFSDYMNELRVNQAKKLLTDPNYNQYTTTAVGLESGFNSKSTFYAVFKKFTGKTPAEYRLKK